MLLLPLWYVAFLLSLTCHEAAHAMLAAWGGDRTAYLGGQVSLNPIPHMRREPVGTILLPLLSYLQADWMMGWASAPYDPRWEERYPGRAATMAAAGPATNLLLGFLAFAALRAGLLIGAWEPIAGSTVALDQLVVATSQQTAIFEGLGRLLSIMLVLNLLLFLFNLLPLPPLDGASVLAGVVAPARGLIRGMRGSPLMALAGILIA